MFGDIKKAVFPIAGLGTRFLPATKASPKEMLPIVDKPLIQFAVEEAYEAGIRQMIFVTGRSKRSVEDYFDTAYELEAELEKSQKSKLITLINSIKPADMDCVYIRQSRALGLGHAIGCAENVVGNEVFAVLLADDLMVGSPGIMSQLVHIYHDFQGSVIAVQKIDREETDRYGIISGNQISNNVFEIKSIIEKPKPDEAPSQIAVAGRYILRPSIFQAIKKQASGVGGEVQLTDAIASLLWEEKFFAHQFAGYRYDCGNKLGFVKAIVDFAEKHEEIGESFGFWLKNRVAS